MSDPPGMKRSHDDPTSPHPKRHNTEQSNIPNPSSSKDLNLQCLKLLPALVENSDPSERLDDIYNAVQMTLRPIKREQRASFVSKDVFKTNVSHDEAFEKVVRKAAEEGASEEDLRAVVAHSMCTRCGIDKVMKCVLQRYSGPIDRLTAAVSLPCPSISCNHPCCLPATVECSAPRVLPALQNDGRPQSFKRGSSHICLVISY